MNSGLEAAIQEAMLELDKQAELVSDGVFSNSQNLFIIMNTCKWC